MSSPVQAGNNLAKLSRPQNVLYSGLLALLLARLSGAEWPESLFSYFLLVSLYALAAGINNVRDTAVDAFNGRTDNPLTRTIIPRRMLYAYFGANLTVVMLLQFQLAQPATLLISLAYAVLLLAYSLPWPSLQSRGFIATLCLAVCYGGLPVLLGAAQGHALPGHTFVLAGLQLLLVAPLLLAKDYKDIVGDRKLGKRTPLVRYGVTYVQRASGLCLLVYAGFVVSLLVAGSATPLLVAASVVYVYAVITIHKKRGKQANLVTRLCQLALLGIAWQLFVIWRA